MTTPRVRVYTEKQLVRIRAQKRADNKRRREQNGEHVRELDRKFYASHREERIAHVGKWQKENRARATETVRKCHLKRTYGLTVEEWRSILIKQDNKCAICRRPGNSATRAWDTDHDHNTGRVRGILCHSCNLMLGGAKDNPETLHSAISYLNRSKSVT